MLAFLPPAELERVLSLKPRPGVFPHGMAAGLGWSWHFNRP